MKLADCIKKGWVMEGFPQTREQALALQTAGVYAKHTGMSNIEEKICKWNTITVPQVYLIW